MIASIARFQSPLNFFLNRGLKKAQYFGADYLDPEYEGNKLLLNAGNHQTT